jgi:hypothetical protein
MGCQTIVYMIEHALQSRNLSCLRSPPQAMEVDTEASHLPNSTKQWRSVPNISRVSDSAKAAKSLMFGFPPPLPSCFSCLLFQLRKEFRNDAAKQLLLRKYAPSIEYWYIGWWEHTIDGLHYFHISEGSCSDIFIGITPSRPVLKPGSPDTMELGHDCWEAVPWSSPRFGYHQWSPEANVCSQLSVLFH